MDLFNKKGVCLYEAKSLGNICGILISKRTGKIRYAILNCGQPLNYAKADKIIAVQDYVLFKNDLCLTVAGENFSKAYLPVYLTDGLTTDGKSLGTLKKVTTDGLIATALEFEKGTFPTSDILRASREFIIIKGENNIKPSKTTKKNIPKTSDKEISLFDGNEAAAEENNGFGRPSFSDGFAPSNAPINDKNNQSDLLPETDEGKTDGLKFKYFSTLKATQDLNGNISDGDNPGENVAQSRLTYDGYPTPQRIISDYHFLLGRKVEQNIFSYNGDLIIRQGEVVTFETVEKAMNYGKLVELAVHSVS